MSAKTIYVRDIAFGADHPISFITVHANWKAAITP